MIDKNKALNNTHSNTNISVLKVKTENNSLGTLKTILLILIVALHILSIIFGYLYFISFFRWYSLFSFVCTIVACIHILSSPRNNHSKPVWILFLIVFYNFAYIFYFFSNEKVFWHRSNKRYKKILEKSNKYLTETVKVNEKSDSKQIAHYLKNAGNFVTYNNTNTKYFSNGSDYFDDMIESLKAAKSFIFIEFYIIADGILFSRIKNILEEKIKKGVEIYVIVDDFGCHRTLSRKTKKQLKKWGVKIYTFNKIIPVFGAMINYRDHRKIVVVDGKVAYTGGANLADEYTNEKRIYGYWKDCGIKLEGCAVDGFTLMFLRQLEFVSKKSFDYSKYLNKYENIENKNFVIPFADGLEYSENIGRNAIINTINTANEKIWIFTPYFIPDDGVLTSLSIKARAGVDVSIVLPEMPDKKMVYIVTRSNAEKLLESGAKIYVMKNSFVHSKIVLTENQAIVGTINMDLRSFYQQFESAVAITEKNTLNQIEQDFQQTLGKCKQITRQTGFLKKIWFRGLSAMLRILSPFM